MGYTRLGKYDDGITEALDLLIGYHQWAERSSGSTEWHTHFTALSLDHEDVDVHQDLLRSILAEIDDELTPDDLVGHWLVETDGQGFVYASNCHSEAQLDRAYEKLDREYANWEGQLDFGTQVRLIEDTVYEGPRTDITVTTEHVGMVSDHVNDEGRMAVHFDELVNDEGVTVTLYLLPDEVEVV